MIQDSELAKEWENILSDLVSDNSEIGAWDDDEITVEGVHSISNYENAGILTTDKGLIINTDKGTIHVTIQAYS